MAAVSDHPTSGRADHVVQFYGTDEELTAVVGARLQEVLTDGGVAVVIATDAHRRGFESHLRDRGVDVEVAREERNLFTLDAARTLARFSRDGSVDQRGLRAEVDPVLRAAAATGRPVWVFGEMVALLWEAGHVPAAVELEEAWDELATDMGCAIHCAYPSETLSSEEDGPALDRMCALHSAVVGTTLPETAWHMSSDAESASEARRLVAELLERHGHGGVLLADARVVVAELTANAVVHARSPFTVRVRSRGPFVRIEVSDRDSTPPALRQPDLVTSTGRGLRLVAAVAHGWGVEALPGGKTVWAELRITG